MSRTLRHTSRAAKPLTFLDFTQITVGRKSGDKSGLKSDHRVTSKPWQKRYQYCSRTELNSSIN